MNSLQIVKGGYYLATVNRNQTVVRVDRLPDGADLTYGVTNLKTGKKVTLKDASKFISQATPDGERVEAEQRPDPIQTATEPMTPVPTVVESGLAVTAGSDAGEMTHEIEETARIVPAQCKVLDTYLPALAVGDSVYRRGDAEQSERLVYCIRPSGRVVLDDDTEAMPHELERLDEENWEPVDGTVKESVDMPATDMVRQIPDEPADKTAWNSTMPAKEQVEKRLVPATIDLKQNIPAPAAPNGGLAAKLREKTQQAKQIPRRGSEPPHGVVKALAGTGKSTSMVAGMQVVKGKRPTDAKGREIFPSPQQEVIWEAMKQGKSGNIRFNAFGKAIATELQQRLKENGLANQGCEASTFHSMGFKATMKAFGRLEPNEYAVQDLIAEKLGKDLRDLRKEKFELLSATDKLVSFCKQGLVEPTADNLDQLCSHFDLETNDSREEIYALVPEVLEACKTPKGKISFDDMIWLPVVHNMSMWKSDMLLVDERQDLNKCQQELAYKTGHRIIVVGDINQAIFGFAGADANACDNMDDYLRNSARGLQEMELTVTRRCGKVIVEEARQIVPNFEAHESNPEGVITRAQYPLQGESGSRQELPWEKTYLAQVRPGDFILCRCNAPLVSQCFRLLKRNIKANILGRNIGQGLASTIKKLKPSSTEDLIFKITDWHAKEESKENAKRFPSENRLIALRDKMDCILCFCEGLATVDQVLSKIEQIFTDDRNSPGVRLSSIHKAKGLEADRVFLLQPEGAEVCPGWIKKAWERQQSRNLLYVAITRAKSFLCHVS